MFKGAYCEIAYFDFDIDKCALLSDDDDSLVVRSESHLVIFHQDIEYSLPVTVG